jgi:hypothetical protein
MSAAVALLMMRRSERPVVSLSNTKQRHYRKTGSPKTLCLALSNIDLRTANGGRFLAVRTTFLPPTPRLHYTREAQPRISPHCRA